MGELLDVLHETEQLPLPVDFRAAAQCEPIQPLVIPEVGKYRLHHGKALCVAGAVAGVVDALLHPRGLRVHLRGGPPGKERDLPHLGLLRRAQALRAERAWAAIALRALKVVRQVPLRRELRPFPIQ